MKSILKICVLALSAILYAACDFLDTEVDNVIPQSKYYQNQKELEEALNGVYAVLNDGNLYGGYILGQLGLSADLGYNTYYRDENTVSWYQASVSDIKIMGYWRSLYLGIVRANLLLASIDNVENLSEDKYNNIKGEALFFRGFYYYMLVKRFGNIPLILEPLDDIGTEAKYVPQAPMEEVYTQIISDLENAVELVPKTEEVEGGWKVNKSAVLGILTRVCLNMAGAPLRKTEMYAKAAEYAEDIIYSGNHSLNPDYSKIFINYARKVYDIRESIFEVNFYGNGQKIGDTPGKVGVNFGIPSGDSSPIGYCLAMMRCTSVLYDLFDDNDVRFERTVSMFQYDTSTWEHIPTPMTAPDARYPAKFRREDELSSSKNPMYTDINFPILRYADVLLMYAECYAYSPSSADKELAYLCLNQVKRRGHGLDVSVPAPGIDFNGSIAQMKNEIMDERARELAFEMLRKDDLIRWGNFTIQMRKALSGISGQTTSYNRAAIAAYSTARERDLLWPIPIREMTTNALLKQNNGW